MGGVGHVSAARGCGRIDAGRWAGVVWFVWVVGSEVVRRGRVRVVVRRIAVLRWGGSIVGWRWGLVSRGGGFALTVCVEGSERKEVEVVMKRAKVDLLRRCGPGDSHADPDS